MRPAVIEAFRPNLFSALEEEPEYVPPKSFKRKHKRMVLFERQQGKCLYCENPFSTKRPPTLDHIISKKKGGTDAIENLCLCCQTCNTIKADIVTFEEAAERAATALDRAYKSKEKAIEQLVFFKRLKDRGIISK